MIWMIRVATDQSIREAKCVCLPIWSSLWEHRLALSDEPLPFLLSRTDSPWLGAGGWTQSSGSEDERGCGEQRCGYLSRDVTYPAMMAFRW